MRGLIALVLLLGPVWGCERANGTIELNKKSPTVNHAGWEFLQDTVRSEMDGTVRIANTYAHLFGEMKSQRDTSSLALLQLNCDGPYLSARIVVDELVRHNSVLRIRYDTLPSEAAESSWISTSEDMNNEGRLMPRGGASDWLFVNRLANTDTFRVEYLPRSNEIPSLAKFGVVGLKAILPTLKKACPK